MLIEYFMFELDILMTKNRLNTIQLHIFRTNLTSYKNINLLLRIVLSLKKNYADRLSDISRGRNTSFIG